jgi:hypothetical protein
MTKNPVTDAYEQTNRTESDSDETKGSYGSDVGRRTFLRSVGAAGAVGGLSLAASEPAAAITTEGERWHSSDTWTREFVSDSDIYDLAQHNMVEYVGSSYQSGVLYRYFDVTVVSAATHRYGSGDEYRPALVESELEVSSGHNATTSGIDEYDPDVVHGGPAKTEGEVLSEYPLNASELDDVERITELQTVRDETDSNSETLVRLVAYLLSRASVPVIAAAGSYASVAMLALGVLELMAGADNQGGESYTWNYWNNPVAVNVSHYRSLPVQMTEGEDGTFYVTGNVVAQNAYHSSHRESLETSVFFKGKSGL